ncbi:MAG: creatininase family protein [Rhodospirillales bacterium]|nr:creatininase family protein [Rhodospirillales bacterium]
MIVTWLEASSSRLVATGSTLTAQAVAVLPLGSIEDHGPHLPVGTDTILAERLLDCAEPALAGTAVTVLRLPALWLGASLEHAERAGTVSIEAETFVANICAVAAAVAGCGVRRLLTLSAHGGNTAALSVAALKARQGLGLLVAHPHWLDFGMPETLKPPTPVREDVHGGWLETALMLHLTPHLVAPDLAAANPPRRMGSSLYPYGPVPWAWRSEDLAHGGWSGRPDLATAEIGRRLSEHIVSGIVQLVRDLAAAPWP